MKTLLVALYPYNEQGLTDAWHDHGSGMTYTVARNAGCEIDFLDMKSLFNDSELKSRIEGYDLIAFGLKSAYYSIAMKLISMAKAQGSKVIVGGYHVTAAPHELTENPDIDWVFHGESELTFPEFLKNPEKFNREIFGKKPLNLDNLPFMDRSIYRKPLENCSGWWHGGKLHNMTTVISARGCPYKCGFCQPIESDHFGKILRRRSVDSIINELKQIRELYSPDCLMIHDDTFLLQSEWIEEFIEKYPQIGLPFWASGRADGICKHPDLVNRLVKVGWNLVSIGFESGSQRILDKMNKDTTVEQNLEAARIVKRSGAKIYANYMIGMPWETKSDIQVTAKMTDEINAEMPSWAFFTPYPGTTLSKECIDNNWSLLTRNNYNRYPTDKKSKNVDYNYISKVTHGLREDLSQELCDIIIPTYENDHFTVNCLKSIELYTEPGTYRIIWIDNGSKDTTKVEETIKDIPHMSIKLTKNEGFVGAINRGLLASTAPFVCLLNNDTEVSLKWLEKLISKFSTNPNLGIVGPMTKINPKGADSPSNLQLHPILLPKNARSWDLLKVNRFLDINYHGRISHVSFVAFSCAVIKREVLNKIGFLDINYAMGMYDDNDYSLAARKAGFRCEMAIDTCITHFGRSTFDIIEKNESFNVYELLDKNLAYLNKKWGLNLRGAHRDSKGQEIKR